MLLVFLVTGFYWKLWSGQYSWLTSDDISRQVLPWLQFQFGEWKAGRFPAWDPNQWLGQPLVGQAQPGVVYPLNWLLFLTPDRHGWLKEFWLNVYSVTIQLMAAWFAYLLGRSLGRTRAASLLCGLIYSLSGWMGTTDWPQMRNGAVWAPLVLLFLLRMARGEQLLRSAVFGGFFLGVAWLSGHHQQPIFLSLLAAGVILWMLLSRRASIREGLAAGAVFFGVMGATGAAQILPAREYGQLAVRWVGGPEPATWDMKVPFEVHKQYSLFADSILGILFPHMHMHSDPHMGVAAFSLLLLGLAAFWRLPQVRLLGAVAAGGLVYSLAHLAGWQGLLYTLVPMVDKARSPSMAVTIFTLAGAALAAFGLDALRSGDGRLWMSRLARGALGLGLLVYGARLVSVLSQNQPAAGRQETMFAALVAFAVAGLLTAVSRGNLGWSAAVFCFTGLFWAEVGNSNSAYLPAYYNLERMRPLKQMGEHGDIAEFLRRQPGPVRIEVDDQAIPHNFGDWHGLHQSAGYLASITRNLYLQELHAPHMRKLLGVGFAVRLEPNDFFQEVVFEGKSGMKVYRAGETVMPRVFIVHEVEQLRERRDAPMRAYQLRDELHRKTFVLDAPPRLEQCAGASLATVTHYDAARVRASAHLPCRGMLVLSDTYFPGWEVEVDGQAQRIWEPYAMLRGVVVEAGTHQVEFRYRPSSLRLGAALSLVSGLGVLCFWLWPKLSIRKSILR